MATEYVTRFGSLEDHETGHLEIIDDDAKHYAFSNVFDVAATSQPYEKVAVAQNREYVLEAVRAEGTSPWRVASHDEFALCMDGEVEVLLHKAGEDQVPADDHPGSVALPGEPAGPRMGRILLRRGHQALLPGGAAYQFSAHGPAVLLMQAMGGDDTVYRWAEICRTDV